MQRLAVQEMRVCQKCGKGRVALRADDGSLVSVPLDRPRAHELVGRGGDQEMRSFTDLMLEQLAANGMVIEEVVLDAGPAGMRALLSFTNEAGQTEVVAGTPQEGVGLVVRGGIKLYATAAVLAGSGDVVEMPDPGDTIH